jgi:MFS family permease
MGPNITANGEVSSKITVPSNSTAMLVPQTSSTPTYEPFSPGTFVGLADYILDNPVPGRYWLVVYEQSDSPEGGNYGLAIGDRESYTVDEWILIPFNLISIYQWEGQNLALILAPMITAIVIGVLLTGWVLRRQCRLASPLAWLAAVAGFTFIGTAASTFMQLIIDAALVSVGVEAVLTLIFAVVPLILGVLTVRLALQDKPFTVRRRVYLVVLGVAALFIWAGYIVGPALAIAASVMPVSLRRRKH